jgi:hypothetical protein
LVQPFLTAPSLDLSARICAVPFAVVIPLLAADLRPEGAERLADALAGLGRAPAATYAG